MVKHFGRMDFHDVDNGWVVVGGRWWMVDGRWWMVAVCNNNNDINVC